MAPVSGHPFHGTSPPCCSDNGKTLVILAGEPDYAVLCLKWAGGAVVAAMTCGYQAAEVSFNPWNNAQLVTLGPGSISTWAYQEDARSLKADPPMYQARVEPSLASRLMLAPAVI